jgi:hypothetical protein
MIIDKPHSGSLFLITFVRTVGLVFLVSFTSHVSAFELKEHSARYTANIKKGVSIKGSAVRSLKKLNESEWHYRFDVESFIADINESVSIKLLDPLPNTKNAPETTSDTDASTVNSTHRLIRIQPLDYQYTLSAFLMPDRKRQMRFDWTKREIISPVKNDRWLIKDIPDNSYDPLSFQLQLLIDAHSGLQEMDYQLAKRGTLRESIFVVLGSEVISTRFGKLKSIVAKKQRDEDAKRETYLWFSADYPLLLLKMTQRESDGEEYEIQLEKATIEGEAVDFSNHVLP